MKQTLFAIAALVYSTCSAQVLPNKNINLIMPFAAGTSGDLLARVFISDFAKGLEKTNTVENLPLGSGQVAAEKFVKQQSDGSKLAIFNDAFINITPIFRKEQAKYTVNDMTPVGSMATVSFVLLTHPSLPTKTVKELITLARKQEVPLTYASSLGLGLSTLLIEQLKSTTKTNFTQINYNGNLAPMTDLITGRVMIMFQGIPLATNAVRENKLRALAVSRKHRSKLLPNVPTMAESGFADFDEYSYFALFAPKGATEETVTYLNAQLVKTLRDPAVLEKLDSLGMEIQSSTAPQLQNLIQQKNLHYKKLANLMGVL